MFICSFGRTPVHSCSFCRRVHSRSFGSFGRALGVAGFIWFRLLHLGAPLGLSCSIRFVCFIRARPGGRLVHSCSFGCFRPLSGSFAFDWFIRANHWGGWVHSVSFIYSGVPLWSSVSFGFFCFIRTRLGGDRVHSV